MARARLARALAERPDCIDSPTPEPTPSLDADILLAHILGTDRAGLLVRDRDELAHDQANRFEALVDRRASGVCVAYLVGSKEFWGLEFKVDERVLVPRPETEILVEAAIDFLRARALEYPGKPLRVLDVCTGSGCIAIALKHSLPSLEVHACDISEDALAVSRANATRLLGSGDAVHFWRSDLLTSVPAARFDLIVSNPPYVPRAELPALAPEVRAEPLLALDGGEDGLDLIRRLVPQGYAALDDGGLFLVESGSEQVARILGLLSETGFAKTRELKDLSGLARASAGIRHG